jgi:FKBP-type peptidyl-prolyl cis-trans isomerase 2
MVIQKGAIVTIFYVLKDAQGNVLDDRYEHIPVRFIVGCGALPPGLEKRLTGLRRGQRVTVAVPPAEGYGERRPEGIIRVRRDDLSGHEEITVGDRFRLLSPPDLESDSATVQGYIGDQDFLESATVQGYIGDQDFLESATVQGYIGDQDFLDSATVQGYIGDWVYLDCNHPYAGKELHYEVVVIDVHCP